ncbi:MAG: PEP-CTERM sorting domain-containing protein [Betaproteobacteria bacterium]|nr:PEP-CTERM sorting domain-containing protein [Betaproteobacteria bacterium]
MTMVDEPASSAMLIAGLGLMGVIVKRRRSLAI